MKDMNAKYSVELAAQDWVYILESLGKEPYKVVFKLIPIMQEQLAAQEKDAKKDE